MTPELATLLADEVRRTKTLAGRRRAFSSLVNVGTPAHDRVAWPADDAAYDADPGFRADLLTRALERMGDPSLRSVWLTRAGALHVAELDLRWRAAAAVAFARHGLGDAAGPVCFVVTRYGWLDVDSGETQAWPRMRPAADRPTPSPTTPGPDGSWPVVR